jgi:PEGA domain
MEARMRTFSVLMAALFLSCSLQAADGPRVFITDSKSWEINGNAGGANGAFGASTHGGARPQTAEIIKTFGQRCPAAIVTMKQEKADYVVVLEHEGGKGLLRRDNKVAVFNKDGDAIFSRSTMSLGGSVEGACGALSKDWEQSGAEKASAANTGTAFTARTAPGTVAPELAKVQVSSTPSGADIEIDGSFMGSTPSAIKLTAGEHMLAVKKSGYKGWQRKIKVTGGDISLVAELEKGDSKGGQ